MKGTADRHGGHGELPGKGRKTGRLKPNRLKKEK